MIPFNTETELNADESRSASYVSDPADVVSIWTVVLESNVGQPIQKFCWIHFDCISALDMTCIDSLNAVTTIEISVDIVELCVRDYLSFCILFT